LSKDIPEKNEKEDDFKRGKVELENHATS